MKTKLRLRILTGPALLATFTMFYVAQPSTAFAQGALTPPGAPAATMRTLDQIYGRTNARIPITNSTSGVTILQPGSYYLTTNLTVSSGTAIAIATSGVTLDLNGYSISSSSASPSGYAILLTASQPSDITIFNGHIRSGVTNNAGTYNGSGFASGIIVSGGAPANVMVSRVSVAGCLYSGIYLDRGDSTIVEGCMVRTVGSYGIVASTVKNSSAIDCGATAIYGDQVSDCRGESSGSSYGISAAIARGCYGASSFTGVSATIVQNCYGVSSSSGYGVFAGTALNSYGSSLSGNGVSASSAQYCNGESGSGIGVYSTWLAIGCFGSSSTGIGLVTKIANTCTGARTGGQAIQALVGNTCYSSFGTNLISFKYNMP